MTIGLLSGLEYLFCCLCVQMWHRQSAGKIPNVAASQAWTFCWTFHQLLPFQRFLCLDKNLEMWGWMHLVQPLSWFCIVRMPRLTADHLCLCGFISMTAGSPSSLLYNFGSCCLYLPLGRICFVDLRHPLRTIFSFHPSLQQLLFQCWNNALSVPCFLFTWLHSVCS